ncbi:MAG: glycerophosphodiester phosphodiesterase [Dehalococcoidia bacterium]|nr:glycerophosphodiester phosphodiesterase [Dehalococcoidia bacterium]
MTSAQRPLLIAHRYGNKLHLIDEATDAAADAIEIDVWFHRGQLEVGHDKTLGPIPLRWDRWSLALGRNRPLTLPQVLSRFPQHIEPMLDLKGTDPRLPTAIRALLTQHFTGRPYMVSSQNWDALEHFLDDPNARVVRSAGSTRALHLLQDQFADWPGAGGGLNHKLIAPGEIEALRHHTNLVLTWTVNTLPLAHQLTAAGVTGLITDNLEVIRAIRAQHPDKPSSE